MCWLLEKANVPALLARLSLMPEMRFTSFPMSCIHSCFMRQRLLKYSLDNCTILSKTDLVMLAEISLLKCFCGETSSHKITVRSHSM